MGKKKWAYLLVIVALLGIVFCSGCNKKQLAEEDMVTMHVAVLKGPTGIGLAHLIQSEQEKEKSFYEFNIAGSPDAINGNIINGSIDVAAVPTNLAATLYQKTEGNVQMLAINTYGTLYILSNDDSLQTMSDL